MIFSRQRTLRVKIQILYTTCSFQILFEDIKSVSIESYSKDNLNTYLWKTKLKISYRHLDFTCIIILAGHVHFSQVICGFFPWALVSVLKKSSANFCYRNKWLGLFHRHLRKSYILLSCKYLKRYDKILSSTLYIQWEFSIIKKTYEIDSEWTKIISPTYQKKFIY